MLNVQQVNLILEALFKTLEEKVPSIAPLSVGTPEAVKTPGAYGSVVLSALFTGDLDGKLTLTLEWVIAFAIAGEITRQKVENFNTQVQNAVETVFYEGAQGIASGLATQGKTVEIRPLPTLVDTDVLLAEDNKHKPLKLPITAKGGLLNLYLAF